MSKINFIKTKPIDWNEVRTAIKNSSKESSIYVGCDSQQAKRWTRFGLVVIIHIDSARGGKVFVEVSRCERITSMRERLLKEVELSVQAAYEILDEIGTRPFVIHLDINPNADYKSNSIVKEATSWCLGQGFEYAIKPDSWAASKAADHLVRM